jgi:hypothetical protein
MSVGRNSSSSILGMPICCEMLGLHMPPQDSRANSPGINLKHQDQPKFTIQHGYYSVGSMEHLDLEK